MSESHGRRVTKQDLEKEIFDLKNLLEISKSLSSTLDYNILNDSILYTCLGALTVMKAAFFSKKSIDSTEFSLHRGFLGFELGPDREYSISEKSPLIEYLNRNFRCYTVPELDELLPKCKEIEVLKKIDPQILVPLKAKGDINGLLILGEKIDGEGFDARDRDYLLNIGSFAASAIHNAYLFEMTTTDMMTKLKLKHFFLNTLTAKMKVLEGTKGTMSLIMLDIDRFKRLNDTFGHLAGDEVLKKVAKTVLSSVRSMDIAARYGGEEFILLLPDAPTKRAMEIAERIRAAVEKTTTVFQKNDLKVTVSLGVAEYHDSIDTTPQVLISRADHALYRAKESGRNLVCEASLTL